MIRSHFHILFVMLFHILICLYGFILVPYSNDESQSVQSGSQSSRYNYRSNSHSSRSGSSSLVKKVPSVSSSKPGNGISTKRRGMENEGGTMRKPKKVKTSPTSPPRGEARVPIPVSQVVRAVPRLPVTRTSKQRKVTVDQRQPHVSYTGARIYVLKPSDRLELKLLGEASGLLASKPFAEGGFRNAFLINFTHRAGHYVIAKIYHDHINIAQFDKPYSTLTVKQQIDCVVQDMVSQRTAGNIVNHFTQVST